MGKIFDALSKSEKEPEKLEARSERPSNQDADYESHAGIHGKESVAPTILSPLDARSDGERKAATRKAVPEGIRSIAPAIRKGVVDPSLVALHDPKSAMAEQFNMLKTNLLFPPSGRRARCIMVTSALPGEGKSFITANLAISLARNVDEHVLLVDCDLRKPDICRLFGFECHQGLADYLSRGVPLASLLLKTGLEKLTILPGGLPPLNPAELLSSAQMALLVEELKSRYRDRYILIDTPPPEIIPESHVLAQLAEGILLVVRQGMAKRDVISNLMERLGKEKFLGVVLNYFERGLTDYYKYDKYNRYYSQG